MKLIYLGKEIDSTKEHELISENEFGFTVNIKYNENNTWYLTKEIKIYNCTEVHYLWSSNYIGDASIAFESDIHSTGFTRRIDDIELVNIELADKLYHSFYH